MILRAVRRDLVYRVSVTVAALFVAVSSFMFIGFSGADAELVAVVTAAVLGGMALELLYARSLGSIFWLVLRDQHPWLRPLHEFGDPIDAAKSIDCELASGEIAVWGEPFRSDWRGRLKPAIIVSNSWIVHLGKIGLIVVPLGEIVAAHRELRRGRISRWRKGEFHNVRLIAPHRDLYILDLPSQDAIEWLGKRLIERRPALLFGDTVEFRDIEKDGRYAMLEAVECREVEYAGLAPDQKQEWRDDSYDEFMSCIDARFF